MTYSHFLYLFTDKSTYSVSYCTSPLQVNILHFQRQLSSTLECWVANFTAGLNMGSRERVTNVQSFHMGVQITTGICACPQTLNEICLQWKKEYNLQPYFLKNPVFQSNISFQATILPN